MSIHPEFQRSGIGKKLLHSYLLHARHMAGPTGCAAGSLKRIVCALPIGFDVDETLAEAGFTQAEETIPWGDEEQRRVFSHVVGAMSDTWMRCFVFCGAKVDDLWEGIEGDGDSIFHHTPLRNMQEVMQEVQLQAKQTSTEARNFAVHIGDAIHGSGTPQQCVEDLEQFNRAFFRLRPLITCHVMGETTLRAGREKALEVLDLERAWYEMSETKGDDDEADAEMGLWRILCIDTYDDADLQPTVQDSLSVEAAKFQIDHALASGDIQSMDKARGQPIAFTTRTAATSQVVSISQLMWLQDRLLAAESEGLVVILVSHRPLVPVGDELGLPEIADLLPSFRPTIRCCISGGGKDGFHVNVAGIDHIGLEEMVGSKAYGDIELHEDCVIIDGKGRMSSRIIPKQEDKH